MRSFLRQINVEPVVFLYSVHLGIYLSIFTPFLYFKKCIELYSGVVDDALTSCRNVDLDINSTFTDEQRKQIESDVALLSQYLNIASSVPAAIMCIYLGALSDIYGRKPPLLLALFGSCISFLIFTVLAVYVDVPVLWVLAASLISGLTGQILIVIMACFSSISDMESDQHTLTVRLTLGGAALSAGVVVGSVAGGELEKYYGYPYVMVLAEFCLVMCVCWTVAFMRETVHETSDAVSRDLGLVNQDLLHDKRHMYRRICADVCDLRKAKDTFWTIFKRRARFHKLYILGGLVAFCMLFVADLGMPGITYLFAKRKFDWSSELYGYYNAFTSAIGAIGSFVLAVLFKKIWKTSDAVMIIVTLSFTVVNKIVLSLSSATWMMFVAGGFSFFSMTCYPGFRAYISKLVDRQEQGKIFAVIAMIENISPLLASFLFNNLYPVTADWFAGFVFVLAGFVVFLALLIMITLHVHSKINKSFPDDEVPVLTTEVA